jgi:hypothetical protein
MHSPRELQSGLLFHGVLANYNTTTVGGNEMVEEEPLGSRLSQLAMKHTTENVSVMHEGAQHASQRYSPIEQSSPRQPLAHVHRPEVELHWPLPVHSW